MKFKPLSTTRLQVSLLACFLAVSCNPDEFFDMNAVIEGSDAYCSIATTQAMCDQLPKCQSAFEDVETELDEPIFAACIANPTDPTDDGSTPPDDGTTPPDDGTTPPDDGSEEVPPTIDDVIANGCDNLDPKYLYVKTITEKKSSGGKKKTNVTRQVRVKICHQTGNMSAHTIIIACPAVKSHKQHHDDYVGACEIDQ